MGGLQERAILRAALTVTFLFPHVRLTAQSANVSEILGTWRGNSTCAVKESACRDETNIYRISQIPGKPGFVQVAGSKLVDGQDVEMGKLTWVYDVQTRLLTSPDGSFRFSLQGNKLDGNLTRNGLVFRQIHLEKQE